jgi:hypothetical protein
VDVRTWGWGATTARVQHQTQRLHQASKALLRRGVDPLLEVIQKASTVRMAPHNDRCAPHRVCLLLHVSASPHHADFARPADPPPSRPIAPSQGAFRVAFSPMFSRALTAGYVGARREGASDEAESQGGASLTPLERLRLPSLANTKSPSPLEPPAAFRCVPIGAACCTVGPQRHKTMCHGCITTSHTAESCVHRV